MRRPDAAPPSDPQPLGIGESDVRTFSHRDSARSGHECPSTARVYDALLGGTDNFAVDREAAEVFLQHIPQAQRCAHENRSALIRGVEYLVRSAGIDQLLDIGCGLPSGKNTHQAAQEINPDARVVYVDHDPMVVAHGHAMLRGTRAPSSSPASCAIPKRSWTTPRCRRRWTSIGR
ncbi:hypothetical protein GCM10029992_34430 [Glycomyces albus]